jgi:hypothetical protein
MSFYNLSQILSQFKSRTVADNSFIYSHVVTSYEMSIKNTHLVLDMVQWVMDFLIKNEKFCTTNAVQYSTLLIY